MVRKIDWESQIGRRLRLRDLHVLSTVVQRGSMAKAAAHLGVSQPAVSEVIGNLEHALGVRLLDRKPHGVEPTIYGRVLLKRSLAAFDELKQSIRDIEFLHDPTVGELRIGCAESLAASILSPVIQRFAQQCPRVVLHVNDINTPTLDLPELRERKLDVVLARIVRPLANEGDDIDVEILFDDAMVLAAGTHTRWARRAKIELAELANEPWILTPPDTWNHRLVAEAFHAQGLAMPAISLVTFSVQLRTKLLATGPYITAFPATILRPNGKPFAVKRLPVGLPERPWPVAVVTLKNRTLSPVVQLFVEHVRAFTRAMTAA
jgi:DNA-binding transcriptional LysR family regulator